MTKTVELEIVSSGPPTSAVVSLADRSARIRAYHDGCKRSAVGQAIYAVLCGLELNAAKDELAHGKFIAWREKNHSDISKSTAANYMNLAEAISTKSPTIGNFVAEPLQLTNGELPADQQNELLAALRDCTKGTTLTELFREFGIIKQPKRQSYTAPKDQTPEEQARALEQQAADHIEALCADLEFVTVELLGRASSKDRQRLLDALVEKSKFIRSLGSARVSRASAGVAPAPSRARKQTKGRKK